MLSQSRVLARRLLKSNYYLYRTYRSTRVQWRDRSLLAGNPVLVFQMGKVGSTAVLRALTDKLGRGAAVHVHTLSLTGLERADAYYRLRFRDSHRIDDVYLRSRLIASNLDRMRARGSIRVITLVRDPVARNLSAFFQDLDAEDPDLAAAVRSRPSSTDLLGEVIGAFQEWRWLRDPFEWFERELFDVFGIDVLAQPFDRARGFSLYSHDGVEVCVIRLENLNMCFETAMHEFLAVSDLRVGSANEGSSKYYSDIYDFLVASRPVDPGICDQLYASPFVKHFYSPHEIEQFRSRWASGATG